MYISNVIDDLTEELDDRISDVADHLARSLSRAEAFRDWLPHREFSRREWGTRPEPITAPELHVAAYLTSWQRFAWRFYGDAKRRSVTEANARFQDDARKFDAKWESDVAYREAEIRKFDEKLREIEQAVTEHNQSVNRLVRLSEGGDVGAQWELFESRFAAFLLRLDPLTGGHRITYSAESRRVVVEFEMPTKTVVPVEKSVRFLKTTGEHRYSYRSETDVKRMYVAFAAQAVLGVLNASIRLSDPRLVETVGVNAVVEAPDPATGVMTHIPIISVVSSRSVLEQIQFAEVDPVVCLRHLSAVVSRSPAEVVPIRPIVRLDMTDPRFVADIDVLADLDTRPNLMELTPSEFEALVQNLFSKMGLDTKQTRPSRDGGVDAIAYDPRPILGGKIVIQAKRYKGTVGVSAVRDLFGTLQNEGGSKGILVTTSGYGSASFEFAKNKPLELIDGGNLLFLLKEHAGIDAKIVMPDDWVDPRPDGS